MTTLGEGLPEVPAGLFEGDKGLLNADARWALTRVLGDKTVTAAKQGPRLWAALLTHREVIVSRLHEMYLDLHVDEAAQVAFKTQIRVEGNSYRALVKESTYSREATALLLFLRETHFQHTQAGQAEVRVTREEMTTQMGDFIHPEERNLTRRSAAMNEAITQLVTQTVLLPVRGNNDAFVISSVIEPLLPSAAIGRIADWLTRPTSLPEELLAADEEPDPLDDTDEEDQ